MAENTPIRYWPMLQQLLFFLIVIVLEGCAIESKLLISEDIKERKYFSLDAKNLDGFYGNKEYFPRTVNDYPAIAPISYKYEYEISYGKDKTPPGVSCYNPLVLMGFPIRENALDVTAKFWVVKWQEVAKTYTAKCAVVKRRNIFTEGEKLSSLKKQCLTSVRDDIELQMHNDKDFLLSASTSRIQSKDPHQYIISLE